MCGLFGYFGFHCDGRKLNQLAKLAERRGPHAWGIAAFWEYKEPWIGRFTTTYSKTKEHAGGAMWAKVVVGHCRLATTGKLSVADTQPLEHSGVVVAHNGVIHRHRDLARLYEVELATDNDSELAAALMGGSLAGSDRALGVMGRAPFAMLATDGHGLLAVSGGQPLYTDGEYFCSVEFEGAEPMLEGMVLKYDRATENQRDHEVGKFEPERKAIPGRREPIANVVWLDERALKPAGDLWGAAGPPEGALADLEADIASHGLLRPAVASRAGVLDGLYGRLLVELVRRGGPVAALTGGLVPVVFIKED